MTKLEKHARLFNLIAPIYNRFFHYQVKKYRGFLSGNLQRLQVNPGNKILDIGCGTGAFLYCFAELGYRATGVDIAEAMIKQAAKSTKPYNIEFVVGDATHKLPLASQSFDLVYSSYVLHGVSKDLRRQIYCEAARLSKGKVMFLDYNPNRGLVTDIVEWAEGGDYFNFIKQAKLEMEEVFSHVEIVDVGPQTAMYLCTPEEKALTAQL